MTDPDVIVVGGGPGGSTAATMLARKGWRVILLERDHFPREHIGESLLPASMPVLEELGVLPTIEAEGFLQKWGATMVWGASTDPWSWYFRETNPQYPHTYQVWRARFDQILLDNARANGVDVREGQRVLEVCFEGDSVTGLAYIDDAGARKKARGRFVVDASGQAGLIARARRLRRTDDYFRNLAVYAYFDGAARLPSPDENNLLIEAYPHGWGWLIPLHSGWASVGVVVDSAYGQAQIATLGLEAFLREQYAQAPGIAAMLAPATLASGPHVVRDWSYVSDRLVGDGYILVGDAACFIDPLFSSGVHLALLSGVLAAACVTTALKTPALRAGAAAVYEQLYRQQYGHFREMARLFYSSNRTTESYFWEARRILGDEGAEMAPREAFIRAVAGQPPQGYERAVLDHGEAPPEFVRAVRAAEEARATRLARAAAIFPPGPPSPALLAAIPRLAKGVVMETKPVIGEGEFVPSPVLTTTEHPEGTPLSPFAARVVAAIDGRRPVAAIVEAALEGIAAEQAARLAPQAFATLRILYLDGALEGFARA
ncbi:MAG: NAD(P)/FAD-dependent oxidoreductase [Tepidiformaceae bacterium]